MESDDARKKNVIGVLENAEDYAVQLQELLTNLKDAQIQIEYNASRTRSTIEETFSNLKSMILAAIDHRKEQLSAEVCSIQEEALNPLQLCYDVINEKLSLTSEIVDEGHSILQNAEIAEESLAKFNRKSSSLGSLPEVPHPSQVPCVSINFDPPIASQLALAISTHGAISQTNPVQITQSCDRPGALLLNWEEINTETEREALEFRLQYSKGDTRKMEQEGIKFCDVYCGPGTSYLVKDLKPEALYSFRVCSRMDKNSCWSAWSIPYVTSTVLPPFEWDSRNENYLLSHERKIATKVTDMQSMLYSSFAQYGSGHSLLFKILECRSSEADEGVGLARQRKTELDTLLFPGIIFVNVDGIVFVDGNKMTTRLPALNKGSTVVFESEGLPNNKIRIVIECEGKTVVYDWKMNKEKKDLNLFFVSYFRKEGWKILVE